MNAGPVGYHRPGCPGAHPPYPVMRCDCWTDNYKKPAHNEHMVSRPQDCNLPKPCRLDFSEERRDEVVAANVSRIMDSTHHHTRSEIKEIIEAVFNAGVTSVVHERGQ
jgi:hypothetical protein